MAKKTTLTSEEIITPQKPTGVATSGPKVTPELQKTMTTSNLRTAPVTQKTAQEISATSQQIANTPKVEPLVTPQNTQTPEVPKVQTQTNLQTGETSRVVPVINQAGDQINLTPQEYKMREQNLSNAPQETPPPVNTEKVTVQTPDGLTTTTKETPKNTAITKDTQWADVQDKSLGNLEQLVEARYGTIATQKDGKLIANIGGKDYEWSIDQNGNSIKREIPQASLKSGDIYGQILANPNMDTSGYDQNEVRIAKERATNYNKFLGYNESQLQTALTRGDLIPGTTLYNDLMNTPQVKARIEKANALRLINNQVIDTNKVGEKKTTETLNSPTIVNALADGSISLEEMNSLTNNSEVIAKAKDVEVKKNEYESLKAVYDNIETDVEEKLKGTNATSTDKAQMIANARKGIYKDLQIAQSEYENAYGTYTQLKSDSMSLFSTNLSLYKEKQAQDREDQTKLEDRAYQEQQLRNNILLQNGDLNSTDPFIQNRGIEKAVTEMYQQFPISMTETPQEKIGRVKQMIAQGMTPEQAISTIRSEITNSERYKDYTTAQKNALMPKQDYKFDNVGNGTIAIQDPKTGKVTFSSVGNVSSTNAPTPTSAKFLDIPTGTDVGVQCGTFARQLCGLDSTPGGNSLEARKTAFSEKAPLAGGMVLFSGGGYDKTYGHIASIESVNQDGTINIVESNLKGDNRVTRRTISIQDPNISGFYNNTPLAKQSQAPQLQSLEEITLNPKATEYSKKSYQFGLRMDNSEKKIQNMEELYKNSGTTSEYLGSITPNFLATDDRQAFNQAQRDFINAILRQESGAVISDTEFENAQKQYLPAPGDTTDTINQKRENRRIALIGMLSSAGNNDKGESIKDIYNKMKGNELRAPAGSVGQTNTVSGFLKQEGIQAQNGALDQSDTNDVNNNW